MATDCGTPGADCGKGRVGPGSGTAAEPIPEGMPPSAKTEGGNGSSGSSSGPPPMVGAFKSTSFPFRNAAGSLDKGISTPEPQSGQIPRFPARKFLTCRRCPFGQKKRMPILLSDPRSELMA
jgi:hypothetical protein